MLGFKAGDGFSVTDQPGELTHRSLVAAQNAYATAFPNNELPFAGSGWVHGYSDGGVWHNVRTTPGKAFGTQINGGPAFSDSLAHLTGVWGADQSVTTVITTANPPAGTDNVVEEVEHLLRFSITPGNAIGYEITWSMDPRAGGGQYIQVNRWNGGFGLFTLIATGTATAAVNGDTLFSSIIGTVITVKINGVTKLTYDTVSDTPKYSQGAPGIGFYYANDNSVGTYAASDFGHTTFSVTTN